MKVGWIFRIPSAASANTGIGTPLLANFTNTQLATSMPSTASITNTLDLFSGSQNNAHLALTSERQQMAAAAIAAAAAANALGGNFVAPRTPTHSSTAVSGTSAIGQLAPTVQYFMDILLMTAKKRKKICCLAFCYYYCSIRIIIDYTYCRSYWRSTHCLLSNSCSINKQQWQL